ncbi:uncharacterized protein [Littorina saxatilis]|uniref:Uncharacterized protein n=1 Tax=Littorina saxatilis TaxID=31220 RepID=A0AAN9G6Q6_9CAEN
MDENPSEKVSKLLSSIRTAANLIQSAAFADFRKSGLPWKGGSVADALSWTCWCHELAGRVSRLHDHRLRDELEVKMQEIGSQLCPPFPVVFNLCFLQHAMDLFVEALVLNPTVHSSVLGQVHEVMEADYSSFLTTNFRKPESALHYRRVEQNAMKHVQSWKAMNGSEEFKRLDIPRHEVSQAIFVRELVEQLTLWLEASNNSVWFQYRLSHALDLLSSYSEGWVIVVSSLVTNLGRFEQCMRPVVRRLLDLVVSWMMQQFRARGTACKLWKVDPWIMARAAEFHPSFREWYLATLEEIGDRLNADQTLWDTAPSSTSSTYYTRNTCLTVRFTDHADFKQLQTRYSNLLRMDDDVKGRVLTVLESKCRANYFSWITLNHQLLEEFGSDQGTTCRSA